MSAVVPVEQQWLACLSPTVFALAAAMQRLLERWSNEKTVSMAQGTCVCGLGCTCAGCLLGF